MIKKLERSAFNIQRASNFSSHEMHYFEKCKEERLCKDRPLDPFISLIVKETPLDLDLLSNRGFFIDFLAYVVAMQIRQVFPLTLDSPSNTPSESGLEVN